MVTEPIPHDNHSPTTLQCIVYWIQSATFRPGAFEIPKATGFGIPCSRSLWKETLRIWRDKGLQELGPRFSQARYNDPDWSFAKCTASLDMRNLSVNSASALMGQDLLDACDEVLQVLGRPSSRLEWTVVLTWFALLLDPISVTSELPCLQNASATASRKAARQPGRLHLGVREQSRPKIRRGQGRGEARAPTIWKAGTALKPVESLQEFFRSHASHEVAFILDRYLPHSIRDWLESRLVRLQLLKNNTGSGNTARPLPEPRAARQGDLQNFFIDDEEFDIFVEEFGIRYE
ncbi:hypothetical protein FRC04_002882 [Tulasnella sp. 424]|nr:hypothetical protein FRC04_002882 [Tulasnella sp. 424]KAG8981234.1 hypothetical protein FRC05_004136 [Tulasnella sp. 425]